MKIGFATYAEEPNGTGDDLLAAEPLRRRGIETVPVVWNDPAAPLDGLAAIVIRSCWDYHLETEAFLAWLDGLEARGVRVFNAPQLIRWNLDKRYLADLGDAGVAVPRTVFLAKGGAADLRRLLLERSFDEAVVKPVVSLGAYQTWRTSLEQAAAHQDDFAALVAERDVMVQPLLRQVMSEGELSLLFFGGQFSHAVLKRPQAGDFRVQTHFGGSSGPVQADPALVEQAAAVLAACPAPPLYARVDGVNQGGRLVLMELEAIDPFLFLGADPAAPERFAAAVAAALGR
ncbi:MAG TPA: hypothetical protein VGE07_01190 [Herpetosiphonaceae bacterium]